MDLLFLVFFCEGHILDMGGKGVPISFAPDHSLYSHHGLLFLVTQVRFSSLWLYYKKTSLKNGTEGTTSQLDLLGLGE